MEPLLLTALIAGASAGLVAGALSPVIVSTGNTFYAVEVTHAILAGGVVGSLAGALGVPVPPLGVAIGVVLAFSLLVSWLARKGYGQDVAVGVAAYAAAVTVALASYIYIRVDPTGASSIVGILIGSVFLVTPGDLRILVASSVVVMLVLYLMWREIAYTSFDPEWAEASGVNVEGYRLLLYVLVAVTGAILTYTVGVLLAHIILVAPGVMASRLARTMESMTLLGALGSLIAMEAGLAVSWATGVPPAACVGLVVAAGYVIARVIRG